MKRFLILAAVLAWPAAAFAEEKPLKQQAADAAETIRRDSKEATDATIKAAREAWRTTKAYLSQDSTEYHDGAGKKLESFAGEIAILNQDSRKEPMAGRSYFQTRVKALQEHLEYARAEFTKLPADKEQKDYASARKHFDRTLQALEEAVGQARAEASDEG